MTVRTVLRPCVCTILNVCYCTPLVSFRRWAGGELGRGFIVIVLAPCTHVIQGTLWP
jgi:hypothetical protein